MSAFAPGPAAPFTDLQPLGRGAMGVVFTALHPRSGQRVALKVLTDKGSRDPRFQRAFREEVRTSAALDHPRVVSIYDVGHLTGGLRYEDDSTQARCPEGSPYLVMELVEGEPLTPWRGQIGWPRLRRTLLCLLDALAHAHARGVIHRDLKPSNVLWFSQGDTFDLKLTDFGLAHALDRDARISGGLARGGTPAYMSPEQIEGRWRDFGPWTDLYALGCMTHALVTGTSPFMRPSARQSQQAHLRTTPPPLMLDGAPPGFDRWVDRLLMKAPAQRFHRAADAAWALVNLSPHDAGLGGVPWVPPWGCERVERAEPSLREPSALEPEEGARDDWFEMVTAVGAAPGDTEAPPIPKDWRTPGLDDGRWAERPLGMGLALFEQRATPLVGRGALCDALWSTLRTVDAFRGPRGLILEGAGGVGKSSLARWLSWHGHALGAATPLRATHSQTLGPFDGLGPMVARQHQCLGLGREAMEARLSERLGSWALGGSAEALTGVIAGDLPGARGGDRFARLAEHLGRMARQRPLVLWIDDAQWGPEALAFGLYLLEEAAHGRPLPVLMVLTVNTDRPASGRAEVLLRRWRLRPEVQRRAVDALGAEALAALTTDVLGLEPRLADEIGLRTRGNPLFAVQLVGDWIQRALLETGPQGFRRPAGAREGVEGAVALPEALHQLWMDRLRYALRILPFDGWAALERGAVLGQIVDEQEWADCCVPSALITSPQLEALIARLADQGLMAAQSDGSGSWRFLHPMLREALLFRAREGARLVDHHLACARMLHGRRGPLASGRRGSHLLAGRQPGAALAPLMLAARDRAIARDFERAEVYARQWRAAAQAARLKKADPRRGAGVHLASRIARGRGQGRRGRWMVQAVEAAARRHGWQEVLARVLVDRAWALENEGRWRAAVARLREAAGLAADLRLGGLEGSIHRNLGAILMQRAESAVAREALAAAMAAHQGGRWPHGEALCHLDFAQLHRLDGELEAALARVARAEAIFKRVEAPWGLAAVEVEAGRVHLEAGRLEEAERLIRDALNRHRSTHSEGGPVAELALAWVLLERHAFEEADALFEILERRFGEDGRRGRALSATLGRLATGLGPISGRPWDRRLTRAREEMRAGGHRTREISAQVEVLIRHGHQRGTPDQIRALEAALVDAPTTEPTTTEGESLP